MKQTEINVRIEILNASANDLEVIAALFEALEATKKAANNKD